MGGFSGSRGSGVLAMHHLTRTSQLLYARADQASRRGKVRSCHHLRPTALDGAHQSLSGAVPLHLTVPCRQDLARRVQRCGSRTPAPSVGLQVRDASDGLLHRRYLRLG